MRAVLLGVVVAVGIARPARAEFCGPAARPARVLSEPDVVLPADGGIVIEASTHDERDANGPPWAFDSGPRQGAPRATQLAPGLVVYAPREVGTSSLLEPNGTLRARVFATQRARPAIAAPALQAAYTENGAVLAVLDDRPLSTVFAVVVVGADGAARSWALVDPHAEHQYLYQPRGCEVLPPGTVLTASGDTITTFYVDALGRRSAASRSVKVQDARPQITPAHVRLPTPPPRPRR